MLEAREAGPRVPRWLRGAGVVLGLLACVAGLVYVVRSLLNAPVPDARKAQRITLVTTAPPPPPKPPEKPPDPPKPREVVKIDQPKPQEAPPKPQESAAPPPGPLGLDAQGSGPGDGFGLAARPGGRDITIAAQGGRG